MEPNDTSALRLPGPFNLASFRPQPVLSSSILQLETGSVDPWQAPHPKVSIETTAEVDADTAIPDMPDSVEEEVTQCRDPLYDERMGEPLTQEACTKVDRVLAACIAKPDWNSLVALATSTGGLVNDEVRRVAWPLLLGYDARSRPEEKGASAWHQLPRHKDEDQVALDVNRSFVFYPKDASETQLEDRKKELSIVITKLLREHPVLSYFQGFHDIVQVLLLVLGVDHAAEAVAHLSLLRIRDFMLPSISASLAHLALLPSILYSADRKLCKHLSQTEPFFALAATLTLYAHEIQEYGDIARLFDFLLAHGAVVSVYFFAVIVLSRREELFEIPADEPEMLHSILSKLPKPLNLEVLIQRTMTLIIEHPPEKLPYRAWASISSYSVLKTTVGPIRRQTLKDGEELFAKQVMQLRRQELRRQALTLMWKYRRPASNAGLAIIIGILSFWLTRFRPEGTPISGLKKIWDLVRLSARR